MAGMIGWFGAAQRVGAARWGEEAKWVEELQ